MTILLDLAVFTVGEKCHVYVRYMVLFLCTHIYSNDHLCQRGKIGKSQALLFPDLAPASQSI